MAVVLESLTNIVTVEPGGNIINISTKTPGQSTPSWGTIIGNLPDQTDLDDRFNKIEDGPFVVDSLDDLAQFLNGTVYELPTNQYLFRRSINFGINTIRLLDANGIYSFYGLNFNQITYTGTGTFISSTATGVSLDVIRMFLSAPNGTVIGWTNGNSVLMEVAVFTNCQQCVDLTTFEFCTMDIVPVVGCQDGLHLNDVKTISCQVGQFNAGLDVGGNFMNISGAASERLYMSIVDSRPAASEAYLFVNVNYGGIISIVGGVHTSGGGPFFAAGSRDQDDNNISVGLVQNVQNSTEVAEMYVADGDEQITDITALETETIVNGIFTESLAKAFVTNAAGRITYTGVNDIVASVFVKGFADPVGGSNRTYWFYIRKNGTELIQITRGTVTVDAANPANFLCIGSLEMSPNDFVELIVIAKSNVIDVTCSAVTITINT